MTTTTPTIGEIQIQSRNKALRSIAITLGIIVYGGMIAYSGVNNYGLLTRGIPDSMIVWAIVGVLSLEITLTALPIAIHWWTHSPTQRYAALLFYALDLGLTCGNVILQVAFVEALVIPDWLTLYLFYVAPTTPVIVGLGWSILFLLDPSQRENAGIESLKAATRESLQSQLIAEATGNDQIQKAVQEAGAKLSQQIINNTLAQTLTTYTAPNGQPAPK